MKPQFWQFVRFGLVGGVNTANSFLLFWLFDHVLPYFAAFTLSFALAMVGSFFLNCHFTYRTKPTWKKFALFPIPNVTNYLVQSGGLVALVGWWHLDHLLALLLVSLVAIPVTFVLSKIILIGRSPQVEDLGAGAVGVEVVEQEQPGRVALGAADLQHGARAGRGEQG
ncbi:GtrA family protein [Kitasatospora sp. MMS16-BH015]|uniref:GtrA family protein n=1 Tax=Kitasatospora sp. MMS16-BH015 TaxID=2018025 RepID=UPI000CF204A3|nr:GtrA family protein [Kitasatospora sp. MMS16-BH015]